MAKRKKPSLGTPADLEAELRTGWVRRSDTPAKAEKAEPARPAAKVVAPPAAAPPTARSAPVPAEPIAPSPAGPAKAAAPIAPVSAPTPRPPKPAPRSTPTPPLDGISRSLDFISTPLQVGLVLLLAPFGMRSRPL